MKKLDMFIEKYHMLSDGDRVIAGISGGADSVCLLFVLMELRKRMKIDIVAVHVNHGIRGENAKRDERFTLELCEKHNIKCEIYRENVELIARNRKQSVEEAGRIVRREAFEKALVLHNGSKIAMAHHQNDNAETLLLNLARGTGLNGLGGIQPVAGNIIRPLLCLSRYEIEGYVAIIGCGFCNDETNDEDEYTRNRLRHQLIPVLEKQVNKQAVRHMNETMEQIRVIQDYMDIQLAAAYENTVQEQSDGSLHIRKKEYECLHEALRSILLRKCLSTMAGVQRDITIVHVRAVAELFKKQTGKSRDLPYSIQACREYEWVVLKRRNQERSETFTPVQLVVPGKNKIQGLNLAISSKVWEIERELSVEDVPQKTYTKWFDYDIIQGNLVVRSRKVGDSIVIDQSGNSQKIKSYFINEKIPSAKRDWVPILADDTDIIWILGYRMSSAYQVTEQTRRILEIKVTEEKEDGRKN